MKGKFYTFLQAVLGPKIHSQAGLNFLKHCLGDKTLDSLARDVDWAGFQLPYCFPPFLSCSKSWTSAGGRKCPG